MKEETASVEDECGGPETVTRSSETDIHLAANGALPPAHYAVPKAEGDGAVQAWIDLLPECGKLPTLAASMPS